MRGGHNAVEPRRPPGSPDERTAREELRLEDIDPVGRLAAQLPVPQLIGEHAGGRGKSEPSNREELDAASAARDERDDRAGQRRNEREQLETNLGE